MARLTSKNYYSPEMNQEYWSVSQYKDFCECEARAMASIRGEYTRPMTRGMLVGSFVDAYFEGRGSLKRFKEEHPEVFTQKDQLRAEFKKANEMIGILKKDETFMNFMSGKKQRIMTGELFGVKWKIKMDSYHPGLLIDDLKVVANYKSLIIFQYDIQGAVYTRIEQQNSGAAEPLPFYLSVATKEKVMNRDIFRIPEERMEEKLEEMEEKMPHFIKVKSGEIDPVGCGKCDYCKSVKKAKIRNYMELYEDYT